MSVICLPKIHSLSTRILPQLQIIQKRFNRREEIYRYVEPIKFKKHMLTATQPYIRREYSLPEESCGASEVKENPLHPLESIFIEELLADIKATNFILFIQYTYTEFQKDRVYKNTITKTGCKFHSLNNRIYRETFKELKKPEVVELFVARNALVTGEDINLNKCLLALNKMPQYLLLGGYIDDHFYNVDQLKIIVNAGNIDTIRAHIVNTLATHSINLSGYLQAYSQDSKSKSKTD